MSMFRFYRQLRELKDQETTELNKLQGRYWELQEEYQQELESLQIPQDGEWWDPELKLRGRVGAAMTAELDRFMHNVWYKEQGWERHQDWERERQKGEWGQEQQHKKEEWEKEWEEYRTRRRPNIYERLLSVLMQDQDTRLQAEVKVLQKRPLGLKNVICDNERYFTSQSPYLDALLVFAGLFSAILSAFLIEIRKGLQDDLLLQILHELQRSSEPFQPTLVSIWVNGLWFPSLTLSMMGALLVMLAKSTGGQWVMNTAEAEATFTTATPEYMKKREQHIGRIYGHMIFQWEVAFLMTTASIFLYVAVILFFAGLSVLLYTGLGGIGTSFWFIMLTMGTFFFTIVFHNLATIFLCGRRGSNPRALAP